MPKESKYEWKDMFKLDTVNPEEETEETLLNTATTTTDENEEVEETGEEEREEEIEEEERLKVEAKEKAAITKPPVVKQEDSPQGVFTPLMGLITEGVLLYDEEKEYENSPEGIKELFNDNKNTWIEQWKQQYPKEALEVLEHIKNGGTLNELIQLEQDGPDYEKDVDLTNETHQKFLISDFLAEQGLSEEKIKAKIAKYEEAGLIEDEAKSAHEQLIAIQKKRKNDLIESQKRASIERETELKNRAESFKKKVLEIKEIAGFQLKPGENQKLLDYMTKPVKEGKTQMESEYNDDIQLNMAYFMMKKFDFKKVEAAATTKATIKLKEAVSRVTDTNLKPTNSVVDREEKPEENGTEIYGLPWQTTIKIKK